MYIVIFTTCANKKEARRIAEGLIERKFAACVNIMDRLESFFWWQGKVDKAEEALLIIKSKKKNFAKIAKLIKSMHSYDVPEIIALPIISGWGPYLEWLDESVRKSG